MSVLGEATTAGPGPLGAPGGRPDPRRLPLVAVAYGPRCVPVMELVEAAAGLCELVWLIRRDAAGMAEMTDLLGHFGPVIDLAGDDPDAAVAAVGPDAIVTYLDATMVQVAGIASRLGLRFHRPETAVLLTDKAAQRAALRAAGIPGPACEVVGPGPGADAIARIDGSLHWPAVLKPRSGQGSRHTFLAPDEAGAAGILDDLGSARGPMVVEEYLPGDPRRVDEPFADYVSVESLVTAGSVSHLAVTGRLPLADNFRETGFFVPAAIGGPDREAVLELATAAIGALGVETGCLHTEIKFTADGPRVIEVNGRVGGGVPEMLDRATGFGLLEWTLRAALGESLLVIEPLECRKVGYRLFLQPPARSAVVWSIDGLDALSETPGVDTISVHQGPGAELDWRDGSRNHIIAVVGSAPDHDALLELDRVMRATVSVTYTTVG